MYIIYTTYIYILYIYIHTIVCDSMCIMYIYQSVMLETWIQHDLTAIWPDICPTLSWTSTVQIFQDGGCTSQNELLGASQCWDLPTGKALSIAPVPKETQLEERAEKCELRQQNPKPEKCRVVQNAEILDYAWFESSNLPTRLWKTTS